MRCVACPSCGASVGASSLASHVVAAHVAGDWEAWLCGRCSFRCHDLAGLLQHHADSRHPLSHFRRALTNEELLGMLSRLMEPNFTGDASNDTSMAIEDEAAADSEDSVVNDAPAADESGEGTEGEQSADEPSLLPRPTADASLWQPERSFRGFHHADKSPDVSIARPSGGKEPPAGPETVTRETATECACVCVCREGPDVRSLPSPFTPAQRSFLLQAFRADPSTAPSRMAALGAGIGCSARQAAGWFRLRASYEGRKERAAAARTAVDRPRVFAKQRYRLLKVFPAQPQAEAFLSRDGSQGSWAKTTQNTQQDGTIKIYYECAKSPCAARHPCAAKRCLYIPGGFSPNVQVEVWESMGPHSCDPAYVRKRGGQQARLLRPARQEVLRLHRTGLRTKAILAALRSEESRWGVGGVRESHVRDWVRKAEKAHLVDPHPPKTRRSARLTSRLSAKQAFHTTIA